jgi:hypothetical protein
MRWRSSRSAIFVLEIVCSYLDEFFGCYASCVRLHESVDERSEVEFTCTGSPSLANAHLVSQAFLALSNKVPRKLSLAECYSRPRYLLCTQATNQGRITYT